MSQTPRHRFKASDHRADVLMETAYILKSIEDAYQVQTARAETHFLAVVHLTNADVAHVEETCRQELLQGKRSVAETETIWQDTTENAQRLVEQARHEIEIVYHHYQEKVANAMWVMRRKLTQLPKEGSVTYARPEKKGE